MKSPLSINERILHEIDKLDAEEKLKTFLKDILLVELDNMDKDNPKYTDQYKSLLDKGLKNT